MSSHEPLELAKRAYDLVQKKPSRALAIAEEALALAKTRQDDEGLVAALHALGLARRALGDPRALATVQAAVNEGERRGYPQRAALARRNLAVYLAYAGRTERALREIETARLALAGIERARSEVHRIAVFELAGRPLNTADIDEALETLRGQKNTEDTRWVAHLVYNRGAALAELGDATGARRDLSEARALYTELHLTAWAADASLHLARVDFIDGDMVGCLDELDAIDVAELSDGAAPWLHLNRAEVLLALRRLPEARAALQQFVAMSSRSRTMDSVTKARLPAARLALAAGDRESAAALAETARRSFAARSQPLFAAMATLLRLEATFDQEDRLRPRASHNALKAVQTLSENGWSLESLRGRLLVARAAATKGSVVTARRELAACRSIETRGTVTDRIVRRYVQALVRLAEGHPDDAERSLRSGLSLLEQYRGALGAVELRATASAIGAELSATGLRIAIDSGNPRKTLAWAERLRGNALRLPVVRPPTDPQLHAYQADLRRIQNQIREAEADGKLLHGLAGRRLELETAIRNRTRLVPGTGGAVPSIPHPQDAIRALGDRVLVEYIEVDGELRAVTLKHGRARLHTLGQMNVARELDWLRFSMGRLARGGINPEQRGALLASADAAAATLERLLIEPLLAAIDGASLVVVPTGMLHAMAWGALPSLRGRAVTVAPSLSLWVGRANRPRTRSRKAAFIAGPGLKHADREVRETASIYPHSTVLRGDKATAKRTIAALNGAAVGHIACHGRFRADSPLFSALELADGPLTMHELQRRLRNAPELLILSSCDLALSEHHPGDELLGFAAAILAMGTRTIVASTAPVPDAATRRLMLAFHGALADGQPAAHALAQAQVGLRGRLVPGAGFICLGGD